MKYLLLLLFLMAAPALAEDGGMHLSAAQEKAVARVLLEKIRSHFTSLPDAPGQGREFWKVWTRCDLELLKSCGDLGQTKERILALNDAFLAANQEEAMKVLRDRLGLIIPAGEVRTEDLARRIDKVIEEEMTKVKEK